MPPIFTLPPTIHQEEFSRSYIAAVATAAGYSTERRTVDVDHVDIDIHQRSDGETAPIIGTLTVQARSSYHHMPRNGVLSFPVDIATYNRLRVDYTVTPHILIVLHMPRDIERWLHHGNNHLILRHCAYWMSLKGFPSITNQKRVTVKIPTSQLFCLTWLKATMDDLAAGIRTL